MDTVEKAKKIAEEVGFSHIGDLNMSALKFLPEVRAMCAADKCSRYGKSWRCPPACGTLEHAAEIVKAYDCGIIVQTTGMMEDDYDYEMTIHVEELEMGEGGSMFNPWARRDAGGMKMSGTIVIKSTETGKVALILEVDGIKGESHVSQRVRMGLMYDNLAEEIADLD